MNIRSIAIQAGIFALLLVTYLQIRPGQETRDEDPLVYLPMEKIEKIEIVKGAAALVLERQVDPANEQKRWVATSAHGYPLPDGRVDEFINPLRQAGLGDYLGSDLDPIKDGEALAEWGLGEEARTKIRFLDAEGEVVEELHLGKVDSRKTEVGARILQQDGAPPNVDLDEEELHATFVFLPQKGEVRKVGAKLEASADAKDWLDRRLVPLAEGDRKDIDILQYMRKVPLEEGLTHEADGKTYPVVREVALLRREESKEPPKDGGSASREPKFEWKLEVTYFLGNDRGQMLANRFGEAWTVQADPAVATYEADPTAVAALLDALAGLEAEEFLPPVTYREMSDGDLQPTEKDDFAADPDFEISYLTKGTDKPRKLRFGRLPAAAKEGEPPPADGEAKGKPWCLALHTRRWQMSQEQVTMTSIGEAAKANVYFLKIGLFQLDEWRFESLLKEAFDFARPEEGPFEDLALAGTVARDAVASIRVVVPETKGDETTEKTLELKKSGDVWTLGNAWGYEADAEKVTKLLDSVLGAKRARVRAKNPRLHKKFGLEAKERRRIVLSDAAGTEILALTLGKTDPFARIPDEHGEEKPTPTTYVLDADGRTVREFVAEIDPRVAAEEWITKPLVSIPKFRIDQFDLVIDGKEHTFARRPGEHGEETKWVVVETSGEIDAKKEPLDRLLDAAVGLQIEKLAEPVAWPEGREAPDAAGLARVGLDQPILVLVLHGREGIDEDRALVFGKVEPEEDEKKEEGDGHDHGFGEAGTKYYVAVGNFLGHAGSTDKAFAGSGESRALAVYEILEWNAERFDKPAREYFEAEATHGLVRHAGAEGAGAEVTRTKEEAKAFAEKMVADQTLEGADATSGYTLTDEYWKAVYRLDPGEIGGPVETPAGYVVVQRTK